MNHEKYTKKVKRLVTDARETRVRSKSTSGDGVEPHGLHAHQTIAPVRLWDAKVMDITREDAKGLAIANEGVACDRESATERRGDQEEYNTNK